MYNGLTATGRLANTANNLLRSKGKQYEYVVHPGVGHVFDIPGGQTYSATATANFQEKMLAFFQAELQ
jgi:dienelactone hydrolase